MDDLQSYVDEYKYENEEFEGGKKAAAARARKALQNIIAFCKSRRKQIQEQKNAS